MKRARACVQRTGAQVNLASPAEPATETLAAITSAYASLSIALEIYSEDALVEQLRTAANETFSQMESATQGSYEATYPNVASFWPSNPTELNDDRLLAAACMLYSNGGDARFKCAPPGPALLPASSSGAFTALQLPAGQVPGIVTGLFW